MRGGIYCYGLFTGFQWQIYKESAYGRKGQGQSHQLSVGGVRACIHAAISISFIDGMEITV